MSPPGRLLVVAAVVVLCALAAAEAVRRVQADDELRTVNPPPSTGPGAQNAGTSAYRLPQIEALKHGDAVKGDKKADYGAIARRDIFRPLVRSSRKGGADTEVSSPTASVRRKAGSPLSEAPKLIAGPPLPTEKAPDPLADLVLTGVIEVDGRLEALLETISTRRGEYVAVDEYFAGFRVVSIEAKSVLLVKDGTEYTLSMGSKELSEPISLSIAVSPSPMPLVQSSQAQRYSAEGRGSGGEMMDGQFGEDMLAWAERQPLSSLERMYQQYGAYMSPEQRQQAERYLEDRRRRGR